MIVGSRRPELVVTGSAEPAKMEAQGNAAVGSGATLPEAAPMIQVETAEAEAQGARGETLEATTMEMTGGAAEAKEAETARRRSWRSLWKPSRISPVT